jgi:3-oxoadipate enol-lactonase
LVGQGLAVRHPELLASAVLANTTSRYPEAARPVWTARIESVEKGGMAAIADAVVERYLHADHRAAQPQEAATLRAKLLRTHPEGYAAACHAVAGVDWLDRLATVQTPTLVIAGGRDAGATPDMAKAIADRIPGAQLEVFADASHLSVAEQPDAFFAAVSAFLARTRT